MYLVICEHIYLLVYVIDTSDGDTGVVCTVRDNMLTLSRCYYKHSSGSGTVVEHKWCQVVMCGVSLTE